MLVLSLKCSLFSKYANTLNQAWLELLVSFLHLLDQFGSESQTVKVPTQQNGKVSLL